MFIVIRHHLYGHDAELLVADEWLDDWSSPAYARTGPEVRELMEAAGATSAPATEFRLPAQAERASG